MIVSWNGRLIDEDEVRVSPFDGGLLRGEGVFETMRADQGKVCHWPRHYARLLRSAQKLSLEVPDPLVLENRLEDVLRANQLLKEPARIRLTLSGNILVTAVTLPVRSERYRVGISEYPINERGPLVGGKVCSYAENMTILKQSGLDEMIRPNTQGELCEGCLSNVFFVMGGEIRTPSLETGCLPGISRELVLERFPEVVEGEWPIEILKEADEVWLSSSTRILSWVDELDGREMGPPGEMFQWILGDLTVAASP